MKTDHALTKLAASLMLATCSLQGHAQTGEPIGTIVIVKGQATATNASGEIRQLARRSDLFQEDVITIGPNGAAQARMVDSAVISFKSNTQFAFNTYSYDGDPATADTAVMTMVRGGFRTLSGSIGGEDQDDYRIDTPYASIGIRGTVHEAILDGDILYTGVYEGGTTISNNFGAIDTGIGAEFDFSITLPEQAPQGLLVEPAILGQSSVDIILASAEEEGDAGDGNGAQTTVAAAASNGGNNTDGGGGDGGGADVGGGDGGATANNTATASTTNTNTNTGNSAGGTAQTQTAQNRTTGTAATTTPADSQEVIARLDSLGASNQGLG